LIILAVKNLDAVSGLVPAKLILVTRASGFILRSPILPTKALGKPDRFQTPIILRILLP